MTVVDAAEVKGRRSRTDQTTGSTDIEKASGRLRGLDLGASSGVRVASEVDSGRRGAGVYRSGRDARFRKPKRREGGRRRGWQQRDEHTASASASSGRGQCKQTWRVVGEKLTGLGVPSR